jgi:hypothetical protein
MAIKEDTLKSTPYLKGWGILKLISISTFNALISTFPRANARP